MAKFLRQIFLGDWNIKKPSTLKDTVDATDRVDESELEFIVDLAVSNPHNKRFSKVFKNGMNVKELFETMTENLDAGEIVTLSNGTKKVKRTVKEWIKVFEFELEYFDPNPDSENQNILISVDGKNLEPEPVEVSKL